eukprot:6715576-Lingulodinium_polyedra.AAC.1
MPLPKAPGKYPRGVRRGVLGAPWGAVHGVRWFPRRARSCGRALCAKICIHVSSSWNPTVRSTPMNRGSATMRS